MAGGVVQCIGPMFKPQIVPTSILARSPWPGAENEQAVCPSASYIKELPFI
jgi:hypothetical protein